MNNINIKNIFANNILTNTNTDIISYNIGSGNGNKNTNHNHNDTNKNYSDTNKNTNPNTNCNSNTKINIVNFSVSSLVDSNTFKTSISDDFIIDKIKSNKKNEMVKVNDLYETKYKECLLMINNAVELNLTDLIFNVELSYFGYKNYDSLECINYIEKKLKNKNFLTLKISYKSIFISWKNITDF